MTAQSDLTIPGASRDPGPVMFSPTVRTAQARLGSRANYERMEAANRFRQEITPDLAAYLTARNSIYVATASADGQPYIQHRGGPPGFIKILGPRLLGFADYAGNRQYISLGNLQDNPKAYIFAPDYLNKRRIKIWGRAQMIEDDPALLARLSEGVGEGRPERAFVLEVDAWDTNCPQHIPQLVAVEEAAAVLAARDQEIAELKAKLARLGGEA